MRAHVIVVPAAGLGLLLGCTRESSRSETPRPDPNTTPRFATELAVAPPDQHADHAPVVTLVDPGASRPIPIREAVAVLEPTRGHQVRGTVRLRELDDGLEVFAAVDGLPAGSHAYHVHLHGDCSAPDAKSAGPHFHFHGSSHDKSVAMITGNLGDLHATPDRQTTHRTKIDASLQGRFSILGRAIVVHEKPNDPEVTPDGGAGARLACGVIGIASVLEPSPTTAAR